MATIRKFKGKWQVQIRKKGYPHVTKSFFEKSSASKYAKEVELQTDYNDLAFYSIRELAYLIKNKKITSQELTKIFLHRINKYNKKINAVVTLTDSVAFLQAKEADEEIASGIYRGPLHGIPYGIKDLASYPGYPTTWGANPYKNQILGEKANVIKRLEESGAVMLCKLSSGSLARGDVWHGGKTLNPWDLDQGSSGSSAGSASATAASLLPFTIGTETLGSIISPSTRCGVTGLRPTYGSVSTDGFMTLSWSMDKVGPIAKSAVHEIPSKAFFGFVSAFQISRKTAPKIKMPAPTTPPNRI